MKKKLILATGIGVGFVLGSRAGRKQYNALVARTREMWNSPQLQRFIGAVTGSVKDHAPDIAGQAGAKAKQFGAGAADEARSRGQTGVADTLDKAGDFAQGAAKSVGEAASNAAARHSSDSSGSSPTDTSAETAPGAAPTQEPRHESDA